MPVFRHSRFEVSALALLVWNIYWLARVRLLFWADAFVDLPFVRT